MARIIGKGYAYDDVLQVIKYSAIDSRTIIDFKTKVTKNYEINIPILAANMDTVCESEMAIALGKLGGLGPIHRNLSIEDQVKEIKKIKKYNLLSAAAIGVKDYEKRVKALNNAGIEILVLDVAHGHSKKVKKTLQWIKENYPKLDVMVGNIATKEAARDFVNWGADAVKVGIGPGSMCTTRIMTGAGVPQLTAVMDAYESTQGRVPICADGGIKEPGDVAKAIGAGANTVMLGSILAGTNEACGKWVVDSNWNFYKEFRGMASYDATLRRLKLDGKEQPEIIHIEGEKTLVPAKGSIKEIIKHYLPGLASGMSYAGAKNIEEFCGKADFIEISNAGRLESIAHGLKNGC